MYLVNTNPKPGFTARVKIHYALRIASVMCFIGHGAFGIITKPIWVNYFAVFGIDQAQAFKLMPVVGSIDIVLGLIILFYPIRAAIMWLVIWGFITALLRPLSGEPFAEFIERAGNFGAPLALLIFSDAVSVKNIFQPLTPYVEMSEKMLRSLTITLRALVFLLLAGHGWLNLMEKESIVNQYKSLGFSNGGETAQLIGFFEIFAALTIFIKPVRFFILILFIWKISSELFYPHHEILEWIERGGSYGSILALWFALGASSTAHQKSSGFNKMGSQLFNYDNTGINFFVPVYKLFTK